MTKKEFRPNRLVLLFFVAVVGFVCPLKSGAEGVDAFDEISVSSAALKDERIIVALVKELSLSSSAMQKLYREVRDEQDLKDPATFILFKQEARALRVERVYSKHRMPERVFLIGMKREIRNVLSQREKPQSRGKPDFRGTNDRWLAFLVPVQKGNALSSPEAKAAYQKLRKAKVFTEDNVYELYLNAGAYKISDPGAEIRSYEFAVSPSVMNDLSRLQSQVRSYYRTINQAKAIPSRKRIDELLGSLQSDFAKKVTTELFKEHLVPDGAIHDITVTPTRLKRKGGEVSFDVRVGEGVEVKRLELLLKQRKKIVYRSPLKGARDDEASWYSAEIMVEPRFKRKSEKKKKKKVASKSRRIRGKKRRKRFGERFQPVVEIEFGDGQVATARGSEITLGRIYKKKKRKKRH